MKRVKSLKISKNFMIVKCEKKTKKPTKHTKPMKQVKLMKCKSVIRKIYESQPKIDLPLFNLFNLFMFTYIIQWLRIKN